MYPKDDSQYEETTITAARKESSGWTIDREDGFSFYVPAESPVKPEAGMSARFYGRGIGYPVRGLFIDGHRVFYRTEAEDSERHEVETYGADAADWLARWDAGKSVWSIEMGGLGPGYEQAIQITVAEALRVMFALGLDASAWASDGGPWRRDCDAVETDLFKSGTVKALGLSGAQAGAAIGLAARIYRDGPRAVMKAAAVKDRHIQVSRTFPVAA